jgi:nitrogen fixation protein NifU and related proteins
MSDMQELYRELIIDHGRHPRNFSCLENATHTKEGFNPLCGDQLTVYLLEEAGVIRDVQFQGVGCAISVASASLMTEALKGKTVTATNLLFEKFHQLVTGNSVDEQDLGKLKALAGVAQYPARVKCATLSWHTVIAALQNSPTLVSTE